MTDAYAEELLIKKFKELDILEKTEDELFPEVAFPNETFTRPDDGYWYEIYFIPAEPIPAELFGAGRSRWVGIMQINVCVPVNSGTAAINDRYEAIAALFRSGLIIEGLRITKTYRSPARGIGDYYVMPVSIEWQADLDR